MRANRPVLYAAAVLGAAMITVAQVAVAQIPTPGNASGGKKAPEDPHVTGPFNPNDKGYAHMTFESNVGSFKLLGSDPVLAQGTMDLQFKGTVLISNLAPEAKVTVSGDIRKEYETKDHAKQVYFGSGTMRIVGRFRALQFFGQNLKGRFFGLGIFRFYGEFDKNLNTGTYQYENGEKIPWGTGGGNIAVPNAQMGAGNATVKVKKAGG